LYFPGPSYILKKLMEDKEYPTNQIEPLAPATGVLNRAQLTPKKALALLAVVILIVGIIYYNNNHRPFTGEDAGKVINDALKDTDTAGAHNAEYVSIVKDSYAQIKTESDTVLAHDRKLAQSDILQISSFSDKKEMQTMVGDIGLAMDEMRTLETRYVDIAESAFRSNLNKSTLSEEFKNGFMTGISESIRNSEVKELRNARLVSAAELYAEIAKLYEYLIANYEHYTLGFNEANEIDIFFDDESRLEEFTARAGQVQALSEVFTQKDQAVVDFTNTRLGQYGVNGQDIVDYFQK
jgi:hypothetical protein